MLCVLFVLAMGACGNFGGCGACGASQPLPPGGLPATQTIEGGAQIRVTPQGFAKLTSILPGALNNALGNGFCVGDGKSGTPTGGFLATGVEYCYKNDCAGPSQGCQANVSINNNGLSLSVTDTQTLNVALSTSVSATVPIRGQVLGVGFSCSITGTSTDLAGNFDVKFGIDATTGELTVHLANVNSFKLNMSFTGCSVVSDILDLLGGLVDSFAGQFVIQLLSPVLDGLLQNMLPNPLGIAGMLDVGKMLAGISPGTKAEMEARLVPGGYVSLNGNGMSLGVITGINSDLDPSTRTGTRGDGVPYASEPSLCVPPLGVPDFSAAPFSLPTTSRGTFEMLPADEFDGMPDPTGADLAMGISHTTLDQLGHHLVTSGAMCLGVGTSYINQLNVGTIGILVPSLGDLADDSGKNPLLLVTRPQREVSFTIGDNTTASPALTIHLEHMEVDFYAFVFERYVRAFTLDLTMNIGVNLQFQQMPNMPAQIVMSLVGISSSNVQVTVLNSEFVKETPQHLEMVLPSVFDLVTPLLGNLPPITVPTFAGFSLNNLSITKVTTSQDEFLALYASLGASPMMRMLGLKETSMAQAVAAMDGALPPLQPASTGQAHIVKVDTPLPEQIRASFLREKTGALPTITVEADRYDAGGRELEWTWRFDNGMWHEWQPGGTIAISDRAFAFQGKYQIGLRSRVKGDYRTNTDLAPMPVTIDSVGPRVFADRVGWNDDELVVPIYDVVSGKNVRVAFGRPGATTPDTEWVAYADMHLTREQAQALAVGGQLAVFTKDEVGNQTIELVSAFHGSAGANGCGCDSTGPSAGGVAMFALVGIFVLRRRRPRWVRRVIKSRLAANVGVWALMSVASSLVPGCNCSNAGKSCETAKDCGPDFCPKGQLPFCIDNTCVCSDDIPPGRIGPYSSVAASPDGSIWVSAYAQTYGDLVVAQTQGGRIPTETWEWVDGVPTDANVDVPGSMIRGGISANGPDVGMYTSIQVEPDGTPVVTYFDVDNASLKFAARVGGTWQIHTIDAGGGGVEVGMYTSLTLRSDDGRPGVAYLAHVTDANGVHAELRYAAAQTAMPTQASDWQHWVVDTGSVPMDDIYPLPEGLGLWITSARDPRNQAPVVAYYDRGAGQLKLSRLDASSGQFTAAVVLDGASSSGNDAG
ncbi:MAG: MYXO-CTERM sorting domain-containing protein, partial [Acidobacteriota bacterium]